jgi:hypothetical protein
VRFLRRKDENVITTGVRGLLRRPLAAGRAVKANSNFSRERHFNVLEVKWN